MFLRTLLCGLLAVGALFSLGCGGSATTSGRNPNAPITTLSPPPGPFNDTVTVTLTTDKPANIFVTTDRTDPHVASLSRLAGPSPLTIEIKRSTTLTYFARTSGGDEELVQTADYIRAGGKKGTISGVIVAGNLVAGAPITLQMNGNTEQVFPAITKATEIPFSISNLQSGSYRLRAAADMNGDGRILPLLDQLSDPNTIELNLSDPYKASAENVKLYLGASAPNLCTIEGKVTVERPQLGQFVSVIPLSPDLLQNVGGQGGGDPQVLLQMLRSGSQILVNEDQTEYPYAITNLECGTYVPVPLLSTLSLTNPQLNFIANILRTLRLSPGEVAEASFTFGSTTVGGTVTLQPQTAPSGFVYGLVAAKQMNFSSGIQAVIAPALFREGSTPGELGGDYGALGLRNSGSFDVRVFTNIDDGATTNPNPGMPDLGTAVGPLLDALVWVLNPLAAEPAHFTFSATGADVVKDVTLQLP